MKTLNYTFAAGSIALIIALMAVSCGGAPQAETPTDLKPFTDEEIGIISKTIWGEARGCSEIQQEAVIWCILNRVDDERFPNSIRGVVTQPGQFFGYSEWNPVDENIRETVWKVLLVWATEGIMPADERERVLPKEYVFFSGNGKENTFTTEYAGNDVWDLTQYENVTYDPPQTYKTCY